MQLQPLYIPRLNLEANMSHSIHRNCVGWWPLTERGGGISQNLLRHIVLTTSANAQLGVLDTIGYTAYANGSANTCLRCRVSSEPLFIQGPFTVSIWYRPQALTSANIASWAGGLGSDQFWQLNTDSSGNLRLYISRDDTVLVGSLHPQKLVINKWYHVAGSFDGTTFRIWLNGIPGPLTTLGGAICSAPYDGFGVFGKRFYNTVQGEATGYAQNFRYWTRTLSDYDIQMLYIDPWIGIKETKTIKYFIPLSVSATTPTRRVNIHRGLFGLSNGGKVSI